MGLQNMQQQFYGISNASDRYYGAATALTYSVFKSRDRKNSPVQKKKLIVWTILGSRILAAANGADSIEDYLQLLCEGLKSWLNPKELARVVNPESRIFRVNVDASEIMELNQDTFLNIFGFRDLIEDLASHEVKEFASLDEDSQQVVIQDIELKLLDLMRKKYRIIECLCNIKHNIDKELKQEEAIEEYIDVEVSDHAG